MTASHEIDITVPEVMLIGLSGADAPIALSFTAPTIAGQGLTAPTENGAVYLKYTSVVAASKTTKISVKADKVFEGMDITVLAAGASASGGGTKGTPSTVRTLSTSDADFITGIKSAYTGTGANDGHQLKYNLAVKSDNTEFSKLTAHSEETVTVTYTIASN